MVPLVIGMQAVVSGQLRGDVPTVFPMFCLFKGRCACLLQQDGLSLRLSNDTSDVAENNSVLILRPAGSPGQAAPAASPRRVGCPGIWGSSGAGEGSRQSLLSLW